MRSTTTLCCIDTKKQAADIFTKPLAPALWQEALRMLGIDTGNPAKAEAGTVAKL